MGAGAAGAAAAETLRREGYSGRIVLLTPEPTGPYDRTMLSKDYLAGEAPAKWLPLRGEKFYNRLKIEVATGSRVVRPGPAQPHPEPGGRLTLAGRPHPAGHRDAWP